MELEEAIEEIQRAFVDELLVDMENEDVKQISGLTVAFFEKIKSEYIRRMLEEHGERAKEDIEKTVRDAIYTIIYAMAASTGSIEDAKKALEEIREFYERHGEAIGTVIEKAVEAGKKKYEGWFE